MINKDFHMHCYFSTDSKARPEAMCEAALRKGLLEICFTDHQDFGFRIPGYFRFDPDAYFKKLKNVQKAYEGRLTVRIGVEIGLIPDNETLHREIVSFIDSYPWDFVIGSTHVLPVEFDGEVLYIDPAHPDERARSWYHYGSTEKLMSVCYEAMLKNMEQYDCFDTVGHIDYMSRYVPQDFAPYVYEDHAEQIDRILKVIIAKGKAVEVNTAGLHKSIKKTNPEERIVRRFLELGGRKLTYGSDAHMPKHVAYGFETLPDYPAEDGMVVRRRG